LFLFLTLSICSLFLGSCVNSIFRFCVTLRNFINLLTNLHIYHQLTYTTPFNTPTSFQMLVVADLLVKVKLMTSCNVHIHIIFTSSWLFFWLCRKVHRSLNPFQEVSQILKWRKLQTEEVKLIYILLSSAALLPPRPHFLLI
jgi:hypothetical protein